MDVGNPASLLDFSFYNFGNAKYAFHRCHFIVYVQENAHFVVVDMVLEMLEAVKWVVCLQQLKSTHPHQDRCETQNTSKTDSIYFFDSGFEGKIGLCFNKVLCHPHACDVVLPKIT